MATLADATLALARVLGQVYEGTATGGSASTLEDTALVAKAPELAGGTLWLLSGALAGKCLVISKHTADDLQFDQQESAVAEGDRYAAFAGDKFTKQALVAAVNAAICDVGLYTDTDQSLTTVADQEEYTLPAGVSNVVQVDIGLNTSEPYGWYEHRRCIETNDGKLIFLMNAPAVTGYPIRLWYNKAFASLVDDTDTLDDRLNLQRLAYEAAVQAWRTRILRLGSNEKADPVAREAMNDALARAQGMPRHPFLKKHKKLTLGW